MQLHAPRPPVEMKPLFQMGGSESVGQHPHLHLSFGRLCQRFQYEMSGLIISNDVGLQQDFRFGLPDQTQDQVEIRFTALGPGYPIARQEFR